MFKKLKDKIAEEVKSSPQRIQQIAQAVVSSASSTTSEVSGNDTFFSIAEEDTPQNSPQHITNNTSTNSVSKEVITNTVTSTKTPILNTSNNDSTTNDKLNNSLSNSRGRKLSTSSMGSDVSFRLPSYDSPAVYHLQSDLDMSASEVESPSSIILDRVSKEQLHQAYRRALDKHQKYRKRYADLAKKYGDLERENSKARSVLVETQDKALRRISELREQCSLEQQAKAHLEAALRMELDDKDCLIQSLKTKLESEFDDSLMSISNRSIEDSNHQSNMLIDLSSPSMDSLDQSENIQKLENELLRYKQDLEKQSEVNKLLEDKLQKMTTELTRFESQISEHKINYDAKVIEADHYKGIVKELEVKLQQKTSDYDKLKASEEENALSIAESKQNMHKELENREKDVKVLTKKLQDLEKSVQENLTLSDKLKTIENTLSAEKLEWESKLKSAQTDNNDLESRIKILQSDVKKLDDEKSELLKMCKLKDDKITDCLQEIDNLKTYKKDTDVQLTKNSKELNELTNKITSLEWSIKQLEGERIALIQKCDLLVKENEILTDTKEKLKHVSDTLLIEKQQLQQDLLMAQQCLKEAGADVQSLKKEIDVLKSGQETKRCVSESKTQNEVKGLREKLLEAENACQGLQQDCSLLQTERANMQFELGNLKTALAVLKQVLENPQDEVEIKKIVHEGSIKVSDLENRVIEIIHEAKHQLNEYLQSDTKLQKLNENLEARLQKIESDDVKTLQENLYKKENELKELGVKFDQTSEALHKVQEDLERLKNVEKRFLEGERELVELQQRYEEILGKYEANDEQLRQLRTKLEQANQNLEQKNGDLSRLEVENRDCLEKLKQNDIISEETNTKLKNALNNTQSLQKNIQNLEKVLEEKDSKLSEVETRFRECLVHRENSEKSLNDANKKLQNASVEIEKLKTDLDNSVAKLKSREEKCAGLEKRCDDDAAELEKVRQEIETYQGQIKVLNDSVDTANYELVENKKLQEKLVDNQRKLEEIKGALKQIEDTKGKEIESWKLKNEEVTEKLEVFASGVCQLIGLDTDSQNREQALQKLQIKLSEFEAKCRKFDEIQAENESLKQQLEKVNNEKDGFGLDLRSNIDNLQKEVTKLKEDKVYLNKTLTDLEAKNSGKDEELERLRKEIKSLEESLQDQSVLKNRLNDLESVNRAQKEELYEKLSAENSKLQLKLEECTTSLHDLSDVKSQYQDLKQVNAELTEKLKTLEEKYENTERSIDSKISNLNQEIDCHIDRIKYLENKCKDYDSVKKINVELNRETQQLTQRLSQMEIAKGSDGDRNQNREVETKLEQIMKEVSEVSNKNLVLEQKCSNYNLMEQNNEKLRLANEKLKRQLDDTLVTRRHSEGITQLTEFEYLKNILYQYLSGGVGNVGANTNSTLVRVIAAVMKFDPLQTQTVLDKEAQKNTLLGQLNLI